MFFKPDFPENNRTACIKPLIVVLEINFIKIMILKISQLKNILTFFFKKYAQNKLCYIFVYRQSEKLRYFYTMSIFTSLNKLINIHLYKI
jgi:4-alpha-glucanotransferase